MAEKEMKIELNFWFDEKFQSIDQTLAQDIRVFSSHGTQTKPNSNKKITSNEAHKKQSVAKIRHKATRENRILHHSCIEKKGNIIRKINAKITQLFIKKTQIIQPFWFVFTFVLRSFPFFPFLTNSNPFSVRFFFLLC